MCSRPQPQFQHNGEKLPFHHHLFRVFYPPYIFTTEASFKHSSWVGRKDCSLSFPLLVLLLLLLQSSPRWTAPSTGMSLAMLPSRLTTSPSSLLRFNDVEAAGICCPAVFRCPSLPRAVTVSRPSAAGDIAGALPAPLTCPRGGPLPGAAMFGPGCSVCCLVVSVAVSVLVAGQKRDARDEAGDQPSGGKQAIEGVSAGDAATTEAACVIATIPGGRTPQALLPISKQTDTATTIRYTHTPTPTSADAENGDGHDASGSRACLASTRTC